MRIPSSLVAQPRALAAKRPAGPGLAREPLPRRALEFRAATA
jgi:hypothetical protein